MLAHTHTHVLTCKHSKPCPPHACTQYTGIHAHRCTYTHAHTHAHAHAHTHTEGGGRNPGT